MYRILSVCDAGLETPNFNKECMSSLALLPPRKFCSFVKPISPRIFQPKSQEFHQLLSVTSSLNVCSQFVSTVMPSLHKVVC